MKRVLIAALAAAAVVVCVFAFQRDASATVTTSTTSVTYSASGSTGTFAVPFPFINASDLVVADNGTTKTLTTHYTVQCAACTSGGTVTFVVNPTAGHAIAITRTVPLTQPFNARAQGQFRPASYESAYDWLEYQVQQLQRQIYTVNSGDGGTAITIYDEGASQGAASSLNCVGDAIACSVAAGAGTVTDSAPIVTKSYSWTSETFAPDAGNAVAVTAVGHGTSAGVSSTGGATSGTGLSGTGGAPNGVGAVVQGSGSANGLSATGGSTGFGVYGQGGATSGIGVEGQGTGTNGLGVEGLGASNGAGVDGQGQGLGVGVSGEGGTSGAGGKFTGGSADGGGVIAQAGNNATAVQVKPSGASKTAAIDFFNSSGTVLWSVGKQTDDTFMVYDQNPTYAAFSGATPLFKIDTGGSVSVSGRYGGFGVGTVVAAGAASVQGGIGSSTSSSTHGGAGGALTLAGGNGGVCSGGSCDGSPNDGVGGNVTITGGQSGAGTSADGKIILKAGAASTTMLTIDHDATTDVTVNGTFATSSSKNRGTCTLGTNCATITVLSGAICVCSDTTAAAACKAVVAATTLTITGTGTDVISYLCN